MPSSNKNDSPFAGMTQSQINSLPNDVYYRMQQEAKKGEKQADKDNPGLVKTLKNLFE